MKRQIEIVKKFLLTKLKKNNPNFVFKFDLFNQFEIVLPNREKMFLFFLNCKIYFLV